MTFELIIINACNEFKLTNLSCVDFVFWQTKKKNMELNF